MSNITNDKVTEFINGYYTPLTEELAALRGSAEDRNIPIILRDTETLLLNIIRMIRPNRILEIGTAVGYSAACFAMAMGDGRVISIERDDAMYEEAVENLDALGLAERVHVLKGDAIDRMEKLAVKMHTEGLPPYDFVFIDAGKSHYKEFWDTAMKLTRKGSVIVCDNVLFRARTVSDEYDPQGKYKTNTKKMREFVDFLMNFEDAFTSLVPVGDGLTISLLK